MKETSIDVTFSVGAVSLNVSVEKREGEQNQPILVEASPAPVLIEQKEEK